MNDNKECFPVMVFVVIAFIACVPFLWFLWRWKMNRQKALEAAMEAAEAERRKLQEAKDLRQRAEDAIEKMETETSDLRARALHTPW
jgi:F0F1-type ATP synthase membrane subunit b/b'